MKKLVAVLVFLLAVLLVGQVCGEPPRHAGPPHGGHDYHHGGWGFGIYTQPVVPVYPYYYPPPPPVYPYYYQPAPQPGYSFGIRQGGSGFYLRIR